MITKIQYNERGFRIGQYHQGAKLTDHDVELIFRMREQGMTMARIASQMECSKTTVWKILKGHIRGQAIKKESHFSKY